MVAIHWHWYGPLPLTLGKSFCEAWEGLVRYVHVHARLPDFKTKFENSCKYKLYDKPLTIPFHETIHVPLAPICSCMILIYCTLICLLDAMDVW